MSTFSWLPTDSGRQGHVGGTDTNGVWNTIANTNNNITIVDTIVYNVIDTIVDTMVDTIVDTMVDTIIDTIVDTIINTTIDTIVDNIINTIIDIIVTGNFNNIFLGGGYIWLTGWGMSLGGCPVGKCPSVCVSVRLLFLVK